MYGAESQRHGADADQCTGGDRQESQTECRQGSINEQQQGHHENAAGNR